MTASTPEDRRYLASHEWHKPEGGYVLIGISQHAVEELTDITYVDVSLTVGSLVSSGDSFGEIESVKATSELYCGIDGRIAEINQAVLDNPSLINEDCYGKGWILKLEPSDIKQLEFMLSAVDYEAAAGG
ncbi:MAG: glycine cleavage system protein GcvH [Phycisphaeraceae bacterium]|nr:glycine cleavage system protein GcvH [Phycisphaeraceae bacterium]